MKYDTLYFLSDKQKKKVIKVSILKYLDMYLIYRRMAFFVR